MKFAGQKYHNYLFTFVFEAVIKVSVACIEHSTDDILTF